VGAPVLGHGLRRVGPIDGCETEGVEEVGIRGWNGRKDRPTLVVHGGLDQLLGDGFVPALGDEHVVVDQRARLDFDESNASDDRTLARDHRRSHGHIDLTTAPRFDELHEVRPVVASRARDEHD